MGYIFTSGREPASMNDVDAKIYSRVRSCGKELGTLMKWLAKQLPDFLRLLVAM